MTFEEWLDTPHGKKSNDTDILTRPEYGPFLRNRLWNAFEAGLLSHYGVHRLELTLEWYEIKLRDLRKENKKLKGIIKGSAKLTQPDQITETDRKESV